MQAFLHESGQRAVFEHAPYGLGSGDSSRGVFENMVKKSKTAADYANTINPFMLFVGSFIPNWLMCRREISQGAKLAYGRLCQFADKQTGVAWPSLDVLADECGVSERQMRAYLTELSDVRLIAKIRTGLGATNRYIFLSHEWFSTSGPEWKNTSDPDRQYTSDPDRKKTSDPLYKDRKESIEESHRKESSSLHKRSGFVPPDSVETAVYADEIGLHADEWQKFLDHFTSNGWKVGRGGIPMRDWKAAMRNWKRNAPKFEPAASKQRVELDVFGRPIKR